MEYQRAGIGREARIGKDMKVTFPDSKCVSNDSHHFILIARELWWCRNCWKSKWLPEYSEAAISFSQSVARHGIDEAYAKELQSRGTVRKMLVQLEEVRLLRNTMPDKEVMLKDIIRLITMPVAKSNGSRRIAMKELEFLVSIEISKYNVKVI